MIHARVINVIWDSGEEGFLCPADVRRSSVIHDFIHAAEPFEPGDRVDTRWNGQWGYSATVKRDLERFEGTTEFCKWIWENVDHDLSQQCPFEWRAWRDGNRQKYPRKIETAGGSTTCKKPMRN
jgi:hypothetical protein